MTAAPALQLDYSDAIAHLPPGGTLSFQKVSWGEYEKLLDDLGSRCPARVSYDQGRLEINMPLPIHESLKTFLADLIRALTLELGLEMVNLGSATFKYQDWLQGLEPDNCFYIQNAARVIGVRRFDPNQPPPPPDVAVEIDITSESLNRFPIYVNLGVPEIWRFDEEQMVIYHLTETGYVIATTSRAFPFLTAAMLEPFLRRGQEEGPNAVLLEFHAWVRAQATAAQ
jgi:Uma2 family endonuclease